MKHLGKHLLLFRLPILWMLLGPPAFRLEGDRNALASLEGEQDLWNVLRLVWWTFWGLVAVIELLRSRDHLIDLAGRLGSMPLWVGLWLLALLLSTAVSPAPFFSLANVAMFFCLTAACFDLALKLYLGVLSLQRALAYLLLFTTALLLLVHAVFLYNPDAVGSMSFQGWRIRGVPIAYTPILALTLFFVSLYFIATAPGRVRFLLVPNLIYALWWLHLAQTRSGYLALFIGLGLFLWQWWRLKYDLVRLATLGVAGVASLCCIGFLYGVSGRVTWYLDNAYEEYVLRDQYAIENEELAMEGFLTLNGRTEAAAILLEGLVTRPMGFGYIAGTRTYMSQPEVLARLPDDAFLGAHNAYLEIWAGSGYLGILSFGALVLWLLFWARQDRSMEGLVLRILLYILLLEGLFESELAYPFHQSPVLLWIAIAAIAVCSTRIRFAPEVETERRLSG